MMPTLVLFLFFQAQGLKVGGVVSDPSGRPVPGAQVACGAETETTNARGEFELAQPCDASSSTACQVSDGFADANRDPETKKPVALSETARKQFLRWGLRGR